MQSHRGFRQRLYVGIWFEHVDVFHIDKVCETFSVSGLNPMLWRPSDVRELRNVVARIVLWRRTDLIGSESLDGELTADVVDEKPDTFRDRGTLRATFDRRRVAQARQYTRSREDAGTRQVEHSPRA